VSLYVFVIMCFSLSVLHREIKEEKEDPEQEEEPNGQSVGEKEVPELEDSPPPSINVVLPSPIRSGLRIKSEVSSVGSLDESQGLSQEAPEEADINQYTVIEEANMSHDSGDDSANEMKSKLIVIKKEQEEQMEVETNGLSVVQEAPPQEEMDVADIKYNVEEMTVIDEVTEEGGQEERTGTIGENEVGVQAGVEESGDGVSSQICSHVLICFCLRKVLGRVNMNERCTLYPVHTQNIHILPLQLLMALFHMNGHL